MLDVLIVGSGPAGLSAAVYAKRANLNMLVVEQEYLGTGQIASSARVDNYLGLFGQSGYDLGERFRDHALQCGVDFCEGAAEHFAGGREGWQIDLSDGKRLEARTVIYCAGAAARPLGIKGERRFAGRGLSCCAVCDGAFYSGKDVAVIGGGDTAMDTAMLLSEICGKVWLIHRRRGFRGSPTTLMRLLEKENVELVTPAKAIEIVGDDSVEGILLEDGRRLDVSGVFSAVGMIPQTKAVQGLVDLDGQGYIIADESGVTSAEGFFAAGDVRTKKLRQVVTAVSDGANAAMSAAEYLNRICQGGGEK